MGEAIARYIFSERHSHFEMLAAVAIIQTIDTAWQIVFLMLGAILFTGLMQWVIGPKKEQLNNDR